jgi:hypothetical protein
LFFDLSLTKGNILRRCAITPKASNSSPLAMGKTYPRDYVISTSSRSGFVKLLRLRLASGKRVPLPGPSHLLGSPFRACDLGPMLEAMAHRFAVLRC